MSSVRWAAATFVLSCPRRVGSDTSSGCLAQHRGPFSSKDQRDKKQKGEKRRKKNTILKCGPWRKTRDIRQREKYNVAEIITVIEIEEQ